MSLVVPRSGGGFPIDILRGRDDLEILVLQLFVDFLPAWQIEAAASPRGPGDHQHLFAAEVGKMDHAPFAIRSGKVRRHAGIVKASPNHGYLAEAPDAGIGDNGLAKFSREAAEIEPLSSFEVLGDWNTHIRAAGAFRFQLELVDARKIGSAHPQILGVGTDFVQFGGMIVVQDRGRGGSGRRGESGRSAGGSEQKIPAFHVVFILARYNKAILMATMQRILLRDLAARLGCELRGDPDIQITGVAGMEQAGPTEITFLANPKYAPKLRHTQAAAVLVSEALEETKPASLVSRNPYHDFARALALFYQPPRPAPGIHPQASVAKTARIGEGASIGAFAVVGEHVSIGRNAILHPHAVIYEGAQIGDDFCAHSHSVVREHCRVGNRVILQNGVVVGGDGFGFAKTSEGTHFKIVQSGVTVIEDDVEIQSLTSIDRATVGETRVRRGAKIDSLVQVGHACVVGEDNIICAQTGLAGSSILGKNVLLAGQVGISGHLTIHDNAIVYAQSGIGGDVEEGARVSGSPAFEAREWLRAITAFPKLPDLLKTVRQLEKRLEKLEGSQAASQ